MQGCFFIASIKVPAAGGSRDRDSACSSGAAKQAAGKRRQPNKAKMPAGRRNCRKLSRGGAAEIDHNKVRRMGGVKAKISKM
jgi:hypothetical protein